MKYIPRAMEESFKRLSAQFPSVLITGPKQVGKTKALGVQGAFEDKKRIAFDSI